MTDQSREADKEKMKKDEKRRRSETLVAQTRLEDLRVFLARFVEACEGDIHIVNRTATNLCLVNISTMTGGSTLGCELEHEGEGLLLVAAILFGDGEVEGGRVVAVADGMPDFVADALVFEVVDELVGCGVLSRQGAGGQGGEDADDYEVFCHGCAVCIRVGGGKLQM